MKRLIFFSIAILMLSLGCESDNTTTNPVVKSEYQIVLEDLPDSLIWLAGADLTIPVNALILDAEGNLAPNVEVDFAITSGRGAFDSPSGTSDQYGKVIARAKIAPVEGWQEFTPRLFVTGGSAEGKVAIRGVRQPAKIAFVTPDTTFKVDPGGTLETTFKAIVSDSNNVALAGVPVKVGLRSVSGSPVIGSISAETMTNSSGEVVVSYNSVGKFGRVSLAVETDLNGMNSSIDSSLTINVERLWNDIGSLTVRAFPNFHDPEPYEIKYSEIRAVVRDARNVGVQGVAVYFEADMGSLYEITPTNSEGIATAKWQSNYEEGVIHILASIPGTEFEATTQIVVQQAGWDTGELELSADRSVIYVSNGQHIVHFTAILRNDNRETVPNAEIRFVATHGTVTQSAITDSLGLARAYFTDNGLPSLDRNGNVVPAKIYAKFDSMHLIDSVEVTIMPRNPIESFTLRSSASELHAASVETCEIFATAILQNGAYAPPGTVVEFYVGGAGGSFNPQSAIIGSFGVAETQYTAGTFVGDAALRCVIEYEDTTFFSNVVHIRLLPGPANNVRLRADPSELEIGEPDVFATISAIVTDTAGNAVEPGTIVRFTTTHGDITSSALTNVSGIATAWLLPGAMAGMAEVTGVVVEGNGIPVIGSTTVMIVPGTPHSITLTADPEDIVSDDHHGHNGSTLTASVFDKNGNPATRPATVVYKLLNQPPPPNGASFANGTQVDSSRTANGVAIMSLQPGFQIGGILIKAYTWKDPDSTGAGRPWRRDTISVVNQRIRVLAGPPAAIDIDYNTEGTDAGGGTWMIEVSARVFDSHLNPVPDGINVGFTIIPDDIATITNGRTENGIAMAQLYYHSTKTYDPFTIQAEVQVTDGQIIGQRQGVLPLQQGRLAFHADPGNWRFDRQNPDDLCSIRTWAILTDGHGVSINNAPILFSTDRAEFYWLNQVGDRMTRFFPNPVRKFTGVENQNHHEPPGTATVYLQGIMDDFFLDDFSLETSCTVWARVEGLDVVAEPVMVQLTRR